MNVFTVFHHLQKDKQRNQRHSLKLGKKRRESSKRNYYIISPRVIIKAIIIIMRPRLYRQTGKQTDHAQKRTHNCARQEQPITKQYFFLSSSNHGPGPGSAALSLLKLRGLKDDSNTNLFTLNNGI